MGLHYRSSPGATHGFGNRNTGQPNRIYYSERVKRELKEMPVDPGKLFITADLGRGVSCVLPHVLLVDENGTLPHGTAKKTETVKQFKYSGSTERRGLPM
jgi:hypothetical protein